MAAIDGPHRVRTGRPGPATRAARTGPKAPGGLITTTAGHSGQSLGSQLSKRTTSGMVAGGQAERRPCKTSISLAVDNDERANSVKGLGLARSTEPVADAAWARGRKSGCRRPACRPAWRP